ncbi:MAG: MurR/RpiR family transcriptional regulator [Lentisphaeria bacterium]|nr:MurR/RpiR family transcriptional regulator [Lentisphaeria bacterium]
MGIGMEASPKVLLKIKAMYPQLSAGHRKIADYICSHPEKVVECKVREIAAACGCDDARVVRFCQKCGYAGIHELRSSLALEFMPVRPRARAEENAFSALKNDFLDNNLRVVRDTISLFDEKKFHSAAKKLLGAGRIMTFGAGSSGIVAEDLHRKLLRMGLASYHSADAETGKLAAALLNRGDVFVGVSFSGGNRLVLDMAHEASSSGAFVLAVTNFPGSPLGAGADLVLQCASSEGAVRLGAMSSRIAQLLIVDFLCVTLALEAPERVEGNVIRTHHGIFKE